MRGEATQHTAWDRRPVIEAGRFHIPILVQRDGWKTRYITCLCQRVPGPVDQAEYGYLGGVPWYATPEQLMRYYYDHLSRRSREYTPAHARQGPPDYPAGRLRGNPPEGD